jgi:ABC-type multidrug transport system ATPase subunit
VGRDPVTGRRGTALLLITQYLDGADELAGEIVVIDHGRVIAPVLPGNWRARLVVMCWSPR